jgi:polysaccharide deacetylase 2 family uncharacterized protein YibQ
MRLDLVAKNRRQDPYPVRLYVFFFLLALISALGLDYRAARRGEKGQVFSPRPAREEVAVSRVPLADLVRRFIEVSGIAPEAVGKLEDADGTPRIRVHLARESYESLEPGLEKELRDRPASVDKLEGVEEGLTFYSWRITGPEEESLTLVFSLLEPVAEKEEEEAVPPPLPGNRVAIIIDDMGDSLEALQEILDLGQPVTISILPLSAHAEETARIAHENGLEVMLHLPGESLNHQEGNNAIGGLIKSGMPEQDVRSLVEESLTRVPYVEGVNNHMGSRITQEEPVMRPILDLLKSRGLYFLDSRTTAESIAFDLARKMGLRTAYRNVFLDSPVGVDFSRQKMIDLFRFSQKTGRAIGIGHPFPETLQALRENIHLLKEYRITPVFASQLVQE